ncbi:MAG: hypothetical protein EOP86_19665 [Verrucomicrobiaceae bacterium]|nr:MAG: hypothetical protein EOP86_19665 [Verrucomicrobiaceae bacterium]
MANGPGTTPPVTGPDFSITSLTRGPAEGQVTLTWDSAAASVYTVQRSEDLAKWDSLTPNITAGGASSSFTDTTLPAGASRIFYRVKKLP